MTAEDLARLQEARDAFLERDAQTAIVVLDAEGRIISVNRGFERVLAVEAQDAVGALLSEFLIEDNQFSMDDLEVGKSIARALSFRSPSVQLAVLRTMIYPQVGGAVCFGEQLMMTEEDALRKMTGLMNEMAGLNRELRKQKRELEQAHTKVKVLEGMLPVCSSCKRIRTDDDSWEDMSTYIAAHSEASFSHTYCSECLIKLHPESARRMGLIT